MKLHGHCKTCINAVIKAFPNLTQDEAAVFLIDATGYPYVPCSVVIEQIGGHVAAGCKTSRACRARYEWLMEEHEKGIA